MKRHPVGLIILGCVALFVLIGFALWWRANWLAYQIYVPASAAQPAPLVIVVHGTGGDARTARQWLGFDPLADELGFIALYAHSPDGQWDAGAGVVEPSTGKRVRRDDVGYIANIIDEVAETHSLGRVLLVGVSDGAAMAFHLSCRIDANFAGLASVAATIPVYATRDCDTAKPLSALFVHGRQDTVLPWDGIVYRGVRVYLSLDASIDWWLARNGCGHKFEDREYRTHIGQVDRMQMGPCANDTEIVVYRINDGGHSWPLRDHPKERTSGPVNRDIDATRIIAEWLMRLGNS